MFCPNCSVAIHPSFYNTVLHDRRPNKEPQKRYLTYYARCPECGEYMIYMKLTNSPATSLRYNYLQNIVPEDDGASLVYPRNMKHKPLSQDVPEKYVKDYEEAYAILIDSPKASAALSRRCLQKLLEEKADIEKDALSKEIDQLLESKQLPSHLAKAVDAIRNVGNFGAHPVKSNTSGQIVDVEPDEARWNLDVLEQLFDFYFVQPAETQRRTNALNQKLQEHGKPPIK